MPCRARIGTVPLTSNTHRLAHSPPIQPPAPTLGHRRGYQTPSIAGLALLLRSLEFGHYRPTPARGSRHPGYPSYPQEIGADVVVSNIGARETVDQLLPADLGHDEWIDEIRSLPPSICRFSMYLGFEGDIEDAGAAKADHWIYPGGETDAVWEDAPNGRPPGMFVSFASLKRPETRSGSRSETFRRDADLDRLVRRRALG